MMFWQKIRIYVAVCVCWILVLIAGWYTCNACRVIDWHVWQVIDWCEWQVWSTWVTGDSWLTCLTGEWLMCLTGERLMWVTGVIDVSDRWQLVDMFDRWVIDVFDRWVIDVSDGWLIDVFDRILVDVIDRWLVLVQDNSQGFTVHGWLVTRLTTGLSVCLSQFHADLFLVALTVCLCCSSFCWCFL